MACPEKRRDEEVKNKEADETHNEGVLLLRFLYA